MPDPATDEVQHLDTEPSHPPGNRLNRGRSLGQSGFEKQGRSSPLRVYVTINEHDLVLDASDVVNPDRMGNSRRDLNAARVRYMDFTDGEKVGDSHRPWKKPGKENKAIGTFYELAFQSRRGEKAPGWLYDPSLNAYRLIE